MTLDPGQAARRFAELNHALASKGTISAQFADAVDQALRNLIESDRRLWKTADADLVTPLLLAVYEAQRTVGHRRHVDARDDLRIALASISQSLALIAEDEPVARHRSGRELAHWLAVCSLASRADGRRYSLSWVVVIQPHLLSRPSTSRLAGGKNRRRICRLPSRNRRRRSRGRSRLNVVQLALRNRTADNYEEVAVDVYLPGDVWAYNNLDEAFEGLRDIEAPPQTWGPRAVNRLGLSMSTIPRVNPIRLSTPTIHNDGSATIEYASVHLRPEAVQQLRAVHIVAVSGIEELIGEWQATSKSVSGVARGTVAMPLGYPISLLGLFNRSDGEDYDED